MRNKKVNVILVLIMFVIGLGALLYPRVSDWVNTRAAILKTDTYSKEISALSIEDREAAWQEAEDYNNSLQGNPVKDPFIPGTGVSLPQNYLSVLSISDTMATLEIPKINVNLPVYHGTSEAVLQKGVGHMEGTALPIGSLGGHSLLTGHTGLPSAKLFTDLIDLEIGDRFYVHVLGKELVYEVDQIKVIIPEDISDLTAYSGQDFVTLITCTPYGVNSHRLLVRGKRIHSISKAINISQDMTWKYWAAIIIAGLVLLIILLYYGYKLWRKTRNRHGKYRQFSTSKQKRMKPRGVKRRPVGVGGSGT